MSSQVWNPSRRKRSTYFPNSIPENYYLWICDSAIDFVSPYVETALEKSVQSPVPLDYMVDVSLILDHRQTSISSWSVMYQLLNIEL